MGVKEGYKQTEVGVMYISEKLTTQFRGKLTT